MDKRTTDVVAYITWVGLLIALVIGDRKNSKFHLNQALVIWLAGTISGFLTVIPFLGDVLAWIGGAFCLVCCFIGVVNAIQGIEKPVPFLGQFKLLH